MPRPFYFPHSLSWSPEELRSRGRFGSSYSLLGDDATILAHLEWGTFFPADPLKMDQVRLWVSVDVFRLDEVVFSLMLPPPGFIEGTLLSSWWSRFFGFHQRLSLKLRPQRPTFASSDPIDQVLTVWESFGCFFANFSWEAASVRPLCNTPLIRVLWQRQRTSWNLPPSSHRLSGAQPGPPSVSWLHLLQRSFSPRMLSQLWVMALPNLSEGWRPLCSWEPLVQQIFSFFLYPSQIWASIQSCLWAVETVFWPHGRLRTHHQLWEHIEARCVHPHHV